MAVFLAFILLSPYLVLKNPDSSCWLLLFTYIVQ